MLTFAHLNSHQFDINVSIPGPPLMLCFSHCQGHNVECSDQAIYRIPKYHDLTIWGDLKKVLHKILKINV